MEPILPFAVIFAFPVAWVAAMAAASQMSGWNKLAQKYTDHDTHVDNWRAFCWGKFGMAGYKGCLWIAVAPAGLHLKTGPFGLFRPFHPPLMIPWSAIKNVEATTYWFRKTYTIELVGQEKTIMIERQSLDGAQRFLGDKMRPIAP